MSMSLNQEFTPLKLLRFAAPSIIMMIFMSMYTIIDGMLYHVLWEVMHYLQLILCIRL